jgi:hypothetical protein
VYNHLFYFWSFEQEKDDAGGEKINWLSFYAFDAA